MKQLFLKDYDEVSKVASELFIEEINRDPSLTICFATGSTPEGLYKYLVEANHAGEVSFKEVKSFNLDNYLGMEDDDENNYETYMKENLFDHIDMPRENWVVPNSQPEDIEQYCRDYEERLIKADIDLLLLGVGENGHIAFNEPADKLYAHTHVAHLTDNTITVNSRFFENESEVPTKAITMGMGSILRAKKIVLLITGEKKRATLNKLLKEPFLNPQFPVSFVWGHRDVTLITEKNLVD